MKFTKDVLFFSIKGLPNDISIWIINFSDRMFISTILGNIQLGFYTVAYQIGQIFLSSFEFRLLKIELVLRTINFPRCYGSNVQLISGLC